MKSGIFNGLSSLLVRFGLCLCALVSVWQASAQPELVASIPATGATNHPPSSPVIFIFNEPMDTDPDITYATFMEIPTFAEIPTVTTWGANNTIMTNTPVTSFPANKMIVWMISGEADGLPFLVDPQGMFSTTGGSTGSGTNRITSFSLGKMWSYHQLSSGAPTPDSDAPYSFMATTALASNRTASAITLTLPNSAVSNLQNNFFSPENYSLIFYNTGSAVVESTFPSGDYLFTVVSTTSEFVPLNFPASMAQPNVPHVTNFDACQSIIPSQAFTLGWDAFQGGTSADYIHFAIGTVFRTPDPLSAGVLPGTARSVQIPAGILQADTNYTGTLSFYRMVFNTNNPTYGTTVYRASITEFNLATTSGTGNAPLVLTNFSVSLPNFLFEVISATNQTYTVESSTSLLPGQWSTLCTTNSPTGRRQIADPRAATNPFIFYRARTGS